MPERTDAQRGVVRDLVDRHGDGRAQQAEDQRDGGRGGQSEGVVNVQQQDVADARQVDQQGAETRAR